MDDCEINCCEPFGIATLTKELVACLRVLQKLSCCKHKHQYESIIKLSKYHLSYCINRIKSCSGRVDSLASKVDLKRDIFQTEVEAEQMQIRIAHIRHEWLHQQHTLAELQDCYYRKCQMLSAHSCYYSMQGFTLCSLIYLLLYDRNAVRAFLEEEKCFLNFLKIAYQFLCSFVSTYSAEPPIEDSSDFKFVMSMFSCLAKISWKSEARVLIVDKQEGQNFVWNLVHAIGRIKHNAQLKLLAWMILHNLSKDDEGTLLLQGCDTFLIRLGDVLKEEHEPMLFKYVLEIVERLSRDIPNKEYLKDFEANIKVQKLTQFYESDCKDVAVLPKRILRNLGRAAEDFLKRENDAKVRSRVVPCVCTLSEHRAPVRSEHAACTVSASFSTSSTSKDVSDKSVQMCCVPPAPVAKHKSKKSCSKHKKHRKHSLSISEGAKFSSAASVSPVVFPVTSSWKRKKAVMVSSGIPVTFFGTGGFSAVCNRRKTDKITQSFVFTEKTSSISVGVNAEDFVEKEIKTVTLLASNCSQTDEEIVVEHKNSPVCENQIVKWSPHKASLTYPSPFDGALPTAKIINRVIKGTVNKTQRIVNRIKIPRSFLQNQL